MLPGNAISALKTYFFQQNLHFLWQDYICDELLRRDSFKNVVSVVQILCLIGFVLLTLSSNFVLWCVL